jgi:hypothetical protein
MFRYSIQTVRGKRCVNAEVAHDVCERLAMREADEIEVLSDREMRLTFYSGKTLTADGPVRKETQREKYVALVRDRAVVEEYKTRQVIDWRSAGCLPYPPPRGLECWNESGRQCEKWRTHDYLSSCE